MLYSARSRRVDTSGLNIVACGCCNKTGRPKRVAIRFITVQYNCRSYPQSMESLMGHVTTRFSPVSASRTWPQRKSRTASSMAVTLSLCDTLNCLKETSDAFKWSKSLSAASMWCCNSWGGTPWPHNIMERCRCTSFDVELYTACPNTSMRSFFPCSNCRAATVPAIVFPPPRQYADGSNHAEALICGNLISAERLLLLLLLLWLWLLFTIVLTGIQMVFPPESVISWSKGKRRLTIPIRCLKSKGFFMISEVSISSTAVLFTTNLFVSLNRFNSWSLVVVSGVIEGSGFVGTGGVLSDGGSFFFDVMTAVDIDDLLLESLEKDLIDCRMTPLPRPKLVGV